MKQDVNLDNFVNEVLDLQKQYGFCVSDKLLIYRSILSLPTHLYLLKNNRRSKLVYISVHKFPNVDLEQIQLKVSKLLAIDDSIPDVIDIYYPDVVATYEIANILSSFETQGIEISIFDYNKLIGIEKFEVILEPKENTIFSQISNLDKNLYDIILDSKNSNDIKRDVLKAYILNLLYYNQSLAEQDLIVQIKNSTQCEELVVVNILKSLKKKKTIELNNGKLSLTQDVVVKMKDMIDNLEKEEREMKSGLEEIFSKYGLNEETDKNRLIEFLVELYRRPVDSKNNQFSKISVSDEFRTEVINLIGAEQAMLLIDEVKVLCYNNNFFNRVGSSRTFIGYYQNEDFQKYVSNRKKDIYLDTSLLAYIFCRNTGYVPLGSQDWDDYFYVKTIQLWQFQKKNKNNVRFLAMDGYIDELCGELQKALSCALFDEYENALFQIGKNTRNVFYNYFHFLRDKEYIEKTVSFADFIRLLGFPNKVMDESFRSRAKNKFITEFSKIDIQKQFYSERDEDCWNDATSQYDSVLLAHKSNKTRHAMEIDIQQTLYLMRSVNSNLNRVNYFVSWDKTLCELRDQLNEKHPNTFSFFAIYSPGELLNTLSMENMNMDSSWLTDSIFAVADQYDGTGQKMRSLVDHILLPLFNTDQGSIKFFNELFLIQKRVFGNTVMEQESTPTDDRAPIEMILDDMRKAVQNYNNGTMNFSKYLLDEENHEFVRNFYQSCLEKLKQRNYSFKMVDKLVEHYMQYWQHKNDEYINAITII